MTLVFNQEQAAAIHAAAKGAVRGQIFVSPFVGRLDDIDLNGMDLISNILQMYKFNDSKVQVLTASTRSVDHIVEAIALGSDIITAPLSVLKEWVNAGLKMPDENFVYRPKNLQPIPYREISLDTPWQEYNVIHELTDKGLEKFAADWNALLS